MLYSQFDITDVATRAEGGYEITIAANNVVGGHKLDVDLATLDTTQYMRNPVVLWAHQTTQPPIGRTLRLDRIGTIIRATFEFAPGDARASVYKNLWDCGYLRAASIGWRWRDDRAEMVEWSILPIPADPDAIRMMTTIEDVTAPVSAASRGEAEEVAAMTPEELQSIQQMITDALAAERAEHRKDLETLRIALTPPEPEPEPEPAAAVAVAEPDEATVRAAAAQRVDLLSRAQTLLPAGTDTAALTDRELLLAAIGDELPDAQERSTDYLHAVLDKIIERRSALPSSAPASTATQLAGSGLWNGFTIRRLEREAAARGA